jgi:lipid-binding SYLF domain-containing protein
MKVHSRHLAFIPLLLLAMGVAHADSFSDTLKIFKNAGESAAFFRKSYGYAVFPTIGEAGFIVGGAGGKGRVYVRGKYVGDTTVGQVSVGFQAGGKAYSQIVFFEDERAVSEFESGNFEFAAGVSAVAITAAAGGSAGTTGNSAGVSGGKNNATTASTGFQKGMIVFTIAKGGLMFAAAVAGQKFSYTPIAPK